MDWKIARTVANCAAETAGVAVQTVMASPTAARRVRHRAHHLLVIEGGGQSRERRPGDNRDDQSVGTEAAAQRRQHRFGLLGLDGQQYDGCIRDRCVVVCDCLDLVLPGQRLTPLGDRLAHGHGARRHHTGGDEARENRLTHEAAADECQFPHHLNSTPHRTVVGYTESGLKLVSRS